MRIGYTTHARLRMRQRGVTARGVEAAVRFPDRALPGFRGRTVVRKRWGRRTLEVVYRRTPDGVVIITAYWLEGA